MNTQQEDLTLYNDLFHYLTGDCYEDQSGHQIFYLYNSEKMLIMLIIHQMATF